MASKISALTALAAVPAAADLAVIVDTSDTTMAASGTTKKITAANLLGPTLVVAGSNTHQIAVADMVHNCTLKISSDYGGGGYCRLPATADAPAVGTQWNVIVVSSGNGISPFIEFQKKSAASIYSIFGTGTTGEIGYPICARITYTGSNEWIIEMVTFNSVTFTQQITNAD